MLTRHILARRAKTVADEALLRAFQAAAGGGGGIEPSPSASFIITTNKGGNDTTGSGTDEKPFLTIGKAFAVAKALPLSATQQAVVLIGPGIYNENPAIPPFVWATGIQSGYGQCVINGNFSIDTAAFAAVSPGVFPESSLSFVTITGDLIVDFTGTQGLSFFTAPLILVFGNAIVTGDSVNGGEFAPSNDGTIGGNTTVTGASLLSFGQQFLGSVNIVSTAAQASNWQSNGDFAAVVTVDSTAGTTATVVPMVATGVTGTLNLAGAGTSYQATAGGVPPTINLSAGAPPPVLLTEANGIGFTASVPGNWVGAAPTNLHDAVNRIANNTLNAHPIP